MNRRGFLLAGILASAALAGEALAGVLNYDEWIHLDAEDLAETGVKKAYEQLLPKLRKYVASPAEVTERIDDDAPSYVVSCLGTDYPIYDKNDQDESWGRATFALFDIVNRQLAETPYRFFAINGGNDLGGMFLTLDQAKAGQVGPRLQGVGALVSALLWTSDNKDTVRWLRLTLLLGAGGLPLTRWLSLKGL